MNRDEAKKLVMVTKSAYPNWKIDDVSMTIDTWCSMLDEYSYNEMSLALKSYIKSDTSGFAPNIGQLIGHLNKLKDIVSGVNELTETEAWGIVWKAIQRATYYATEEFEKFPQAIKRAVGNPDVLREWALLDTKDVGTVIASNFCRNYKAALRQENDNKSIGIAEKNKMLDMIAQKTVERLEDKQ